ncbi:hypothetical protein G7046_g1724 [Stylonectria norvegica]|nr:hypothetical protein G7046_g1724 [Stylonectria norvegica]
MAVLPGVPGLSVRIRVGGELATEYPNDIDIADRVESRCFIESKTDTEFSVEVAAGPEYRFSDPRHNTIIFDINIDDTYWHAPRFDYKEFARNQITEVIDAVPIKSVYPGTVIEKKALDESEKSRIASDAQVAKSLGTIRVEVIVGTDAGRVPRCSTIPIAERSLEIAEKAMKGAELSHGTRLASAELVKHDDIRTSTNRVKVGQLYFHYRSREALHREMVIPRSPSPPPLENLSDEEIRRLALERLQDIRSAEEKPRVVKRELDGTPPPPPRPLKVVKLDDGTEAFDLTDE